MSTYFSLSQALRRSLALAVVAGSALAVAGAQTGAAEHTPSTAEPISLQTPSVVPGTASEALFSSSLAAGDDDAASTAATSNLASLEKGLNLPGVDAQYGRRRYGAPRYRGGNTNADGSAKYVGYLGGGLTIPLGNTHHYDTPSWSFQGGVGRNFSKNFGLNVEFDWDSFGLQGSVLTQQSYIEDSGDYYGLQGDTDGYSHIWSLSLQPIYNLKQADGQGVGMYLTAGAGFYHKVTTFTTPEAEEYFDPYFGPEEYVANEPFDSYTSNSPGVDAGFGLTYKFSQFANERFYAEVRYVVTFNSQRTGINGSNYNALGTVDPVTGDYDYPTNNLYPANSNRSTYVPVKFGIRF